jgi:hypothetical protein
MLHRFSKALHPDIGQHATDEATSSKPRSLAALLLEEPLDLELHHLPPPRLVLQDDSTTRRDSRASQGAVDELVGPEALVHSHDEARGLPEDDAVITFVPLRPVHLEHLPGQPLGRALQGMIRSSAQHSGGGQPHCRMSTSPGVWGTNHREHEATERSKKPGVR